MLDEILAKLESLPEKEKQAMVAEVMAATKDAVWIPNPGPQTEAYTTLADELFYGGQAGGGKSSLIVGLSMTCHERSLILRRVNKDAKKLAEAELLGKILDGDRSGWNGTDLAYRDGKRRVEFGGCEMEDDKQRYKGDPHDLICVGRGTLVRMADGSHAPVETLRVGDMLWTLEGARKLQRVYPVQHKPCVEVVAIDRDGREVARQVQSASHSLLCPDGWFSADDLGEACESSLSHDGGTPSQSCLVRYLSLLTHRLLSIGRFLRMALFGLLWTSHRYGLEMRASCQQSDPGTDSEAYCDHTPDARRPALSSAQREQSALARWLGQPCALGSSAVRGGSDVRPLSLLADCLGHCWSYIRRYGARTRKHADLLTGEAAGLQCFLLQDDAERPSPTHSQDCDLEETQKHTHSPNTYVHPYTRDIRRVHESNSLRVAALRFSSVGMQDVFDLQVEEVNHYITSGGFVNQNCFDEVTDFLESQYLFITIWNRSTTPGQRCRVVCTGNPPTSATGLWVIRRWAAWLDPTHPNPAKPGELRWYVRDENDLDIEVDGKGPHLIGGREVFATSRTFIPAGLQDNPDLADDGNYARLLDKMPKELRDAYRDGKFSASLKDDPKQLIPTAWVQAAQARWTKDPPQGVPMCAIGVDVAQGGTDNNTIAPRHDGWFDEIAVIPGSETPLGSDIGAEVIRRRRNGAIIALDCGGGYGGSSYKTLKDNGIEVVAYKGATTSMARTEPDRLLGFSNKRTECWWRFREALDPDQPGGSRIALPPDQTLLSDLTAPTYESERNVITIEPKEKLVKRIGRSPDRGDAVVMAWSVGPKISTSYGLWQSGVGGISGRAPKVVMGRDSARRRR